MFLSLCAAVTTFLVPLPLLLLLSFGMTAQLPMKSLFWLRQDKSRGTLQGSPLRVEDREQEQGSS